MSSINYSMKELVIRSIFEVDQDLEEIKETLYNVVKETYDKNIEEIYSIPFTGRKVIGDDTPGDYADFQFEFNDYDSLIDLLMTCIRVFLRIKNDEIAIPEDTNIGISLIKKE